VTLRARTEEVKAMAGEKLHSCTLTVSPMHGPIPCEACAEELRCKHGYNLNGRFGKCSACELARFIAAYESMRRRFGDEHEVRFSECDALVQKHDAEQKTGA
jgi:hypothetical protein